VESQVIQKTSLKAMGGFAIDFAKPVKLQPRRSEIHSLEAIHMPFVALPQFIAGSRFNWQLAPSLRVSRETFCRIWMTAVHAAAVVTRP
jgi:hypothetical protein